MNVVNFIVQNWDFILLIVAAIAGVVFAIFKGNKSVVMKMLFSLVTEAEKEYGGGTGVLKLAEVMNQIYPKLPPIVKTFVTAERLTKWVEEALAAAKAKWESNIAIAAYIEQPAQNAQEAPQSEPDGKAE